MPDLLETRLRADAAADVTSVPDLDAFLAALPSARRRRRWLPAVAAAAAVLSVAVLALPVSPVNLLPSGGPDTVASQIVGVTSAYQDPRALIVFLDIPDRGCARGTPGTLIDADEGADEVRITPPRFVLAHPSTRSEADPACEVGTFDVVEVYLDRPLAGRTVIDVASGTPLAVYDGRVVPTAGYLPAGYRPSTSKQGECRVERCTQKDLIPLYIYGGTIQAPYASRSYVRPGYEMYAADLQVTSGLTTQLTDPDRRVVGRVTIDGHPGVVTEAPRSRDRCLTWAPSKGRGLQVCTSVPFQPNGPNLAPLLSISELTKVARGLR